MIYKKDEYFSCYSPPLKDYLINNGFEVYTDFLNTKTDKKCFIFKRVPELSAYLEQWSKNRQKTV